MASPRSFRRLLLALGACLVLAIGLAWLAARRPATVAEAIRPAAPAAPVARAAETPAPVAAPQPAPAPAASGAIPHTQLPLRLLATVVGEDRALSLATIADAERDAPDVMREGELFGGRPTVRLAAIERERVLIDHDGVREQLVLLHAEMAPAEPTFEITREEREHRRDLARRLRELTDAGSDALGPGVRGGLLAEGDVSGAYQDGELVGIQVDGIRAGGLYDRIGLRNGDVVTDINGVSLRDPDALARLALEAASAEVLELTFDRPGGPPGTVQLPTDQLEALLASQ